MGMIKQIKRYFERRNCKHNWDRRADAALYYGGYIVHSVCLICGEDRPLWKQFTKNMDDETEIRYPIW